MGRPETSPGGWPRAIGLLLAPLGAGLAFIPCVAALEVIRRLIEGTTISTLPLTNFVDAALFAALSCPVAWLLGRLALGWLDRRGWQSWRALAALGALLGVCVAVILLLYVQLKHGGGDDTPADWLILRLLFLALGAGSGAGAAVLSRTIERGLTRAAAAGRADRPTRHT